MEERRKRNGQLFSKTWIRFRTFSDFLKLSTLLQLYARLALLPCLCKTGVITQSMLDWCCLSVYARLGRGKGLDQILSSVVNTVDKLICVSENSSLIYFLRPKLHWWRRNEPTQCPSCQCCPVSRPQCCPAS